MGSAFSEGAAVADDVLLVAEDGELDMLMELDAVELVCSPSLELSAPQPTSRSAATGRATIRATVFMTQLWLRVGAQAATAELHADSSAKPSAMIRTSRSAMTSAGRLQSVHRRR